MPAIPFPERPMMHVTRQMGNGAKAAAGANPSAPFGKSDKSGPAFRNGWRSLTFPP